MKKKNIQIVVIVLAVLAGLTFMLIEEDNSNETSSKNRTVADFTFETFVAKEIWEMQKKKSNYLISSYLFIKPAAEDIKLRFPYSASTNKELLYKLKEGDSITVKVLTKEITEARQNSMSKKLKRFITGEKREVMVYKLADHSETLFEQDIHAWNEIDAGFIGNWQRVVLFLIISFLILVVISKRLAAKIKLKKN